MSNSLDGCLTPDAQLSAPETSVDKPVSREQAGARSRHDLSISHGTRIPAGAGRIAARTEGLSLGPIALCQAQRNPVPAFAASHSEDPPPGLLLDLRLWPHPCIDYRPCVTVRRLSRPIRRGSMRLHMPAAVVRPSRLVLVVLSILSALVLSKAARGQISRAHYECFSPIVV